MNVTQIFQICVTLLLHSAIILFCTLLVNKHFNVDAIDVVPKHEKYNVKVGKVLKNICMG